MKLTTIYIDIETPMPKWIEENHILILNTLYNSIFDFVNGDDLKSVVIKVIATSANSEYVKLLTPALVYEFMLIRDNINDTIDALIRNFEELDEYEKCAKLLELRNEL